MDRAGPATREEQRGRLHEYLADKEKLKCQSAKLVLTDRMNRLNPPVGPVSKLDHVDRNKKDVIRNVTKGALRDGKLGGKSTRRTGNAAQQKSSAVSQKSAVLYPEQPRNSMKLCVGPSMRHSMQPRGRLPTSTSGHLNPERNKKPAQETVKTSVPQAGSDHPHHRVPSSPNKDLQGRLVYNKENVRAQASTHPVLNRGFQSNGNSRENKEDLTHRQSSATMSRTVMGPKDRTNSHQAMEEPIQDKFRKVLPGSKNVSQKPNTKTQPLQPPRLLTASANLLHKKTGTNQEKTSTAKPPIGKPPGMPPEESVKHHSRPPQMKRSPTKPRAYSRPQGTTNLTSSLKPGGTVQWQRPTTKGEADKEMMVVPPGSTAASRVTVPQNQPHSTHSSKTQAIESKMSSRKERIKPELSKASGMFPRRVPKTPSAADRKKQLEEWLASKGKTYKRPPMMLLQKNPVKLSWRNVEEKEKQEKPKQLSLEKINDILTECLKLAEEGVQAEKLLAMLSRVPQAEKYAKFWICKVKMLAQSGPFDVTELYNAAICAGAMPLEELREVILDILKAADQTSEGEKAELPVPWNPTTPCPSERQHVAATPCLTRRLLTGLPVSIKLQVTSASRGKELPEGQEMKFLTPVRRSLRVEQAGSCYPEMLKDHDPVVSSLSEILDAKADTQFFFRKNKALPEVVELEGVSSYPPECC